jgi:integrase
MRKLYVKNRDGTFEQVAAILKTQGYVITKTKLELAFQEYIEKVTLHKCVKNQKVEKLYFQKFLAFLKARDRSTIDEVTRSDVDSFESMLLTQMKASSVNRRFNTFKNFFAKCLEWKMIAENPCFGKKKRKEEVNAKIPWNEKVFQAFIKTCNGELQKIFLFLWIVGCRPMELRNLKWKDINYDDQSLILRCGKNAEVSRKFPITKELDELLHSLKIGRAHV